jgi:hypothetical protein
MRKALIAITAFLYLVAASGVVVNLHYCTGKTVAVSYGEHDNACGKCGLDIKKGSCRTEYKLLKLPGSYKHVKYNTGFHPAVAHSNMYNSSFDKTARYIADYSKQQITSCKQRVNSIYLYNRVLRL